MDGYLVVANARAGTAEEEAVAAAVAELATVGPTELAQTADLDELDALLAEATERTLVVAGGDGSLNAAVAGLERSGRLQAAGPLGLIPLGTGNDLARALGLPLEPIAAAKAVAAGRPRPLDLVVADDGERAVNAVHLGLGADAAARAEGLKPRLGALAYPLGAVLEGVRPSGWCLRVEVDGQVVVDGPVLLVGICNGPTIGGGGPLCPPARPDDGVLDVVVVDETGPVARAAFAAALRKGEHLGRPDVHHLRGTEVRVSGDPTSHDVDGELRPEIAERTYRLEPAAWSLLVPSS